MERPGVDWDKPTPNWEKVGYQGRGRGSFTRLTEQ
jgi:hypothetical protein